VRENVTARGGGFVFEMCYNAFMKIGLFIGRFQPLHYGHLLMIKQCASKVEQLIIGLGSVNVAQSCQDPFTAQERMEMIKKGMKELGIRNSDAAGRSPDPSGRRGYEIVELPDMASDEAWVKMVAKTAGKFDISWSGDKRVVSIFEKSGLPVVRIKEFPGLSGTKIRRRMAQGQNWLKLVPLSVRKYLAEIGAVKRVRNLCQSKPR